MPGNARAYCVLSMVTADFDAVCSGAVMADPGAVGAHAEDRKTITHPAVGDITVKLRLTRVAGLAEEAAAAAASFG